VRRRVFDLGVVRRDSRDDENVMCNENLERQAAATKITVHLPMLINTTNKICSMRSGTDILYIFITALYM
jgi:hypothetical protein